MAKKKKRSTKHRLLVYHQMGQRMRVAPLLLMVLGGILLGIGWLGETGIVSGGNISLLNSLWEGRPLIYLIISISFMLYIFSIAISRMSYVEPRPKALHVRAGLMAIDISYKRIKQMRLVNVKVQYPLEEQKGADWTTLEFYADMTATLVDLSSWPWPGNKNLQRLWHKFLFSGDRTSGLLFIVEEPMILNQQIESYGTARKTNKNRGYLDPLERAVQESQKGSRRR